MRCEFVARGHVKGDRDPYLYYRGLWPCVCVCVCVVDSLLAHVCLGKSTCVREQERKRGREREKRRKRERKRERQRAREFFGKVDCISGCVILCVWERD